MRRSKKWQVGTLGLALSIALLASPAMAAQNVANTSQKGSLLIFPLIDVRQSATENRTTVIRIANDQNNAVKVKCYYVNESKGRNDVVFTLTRKQPLIWDTRTGIGDVENVFAFPTQSLYPAPWDRTTVGELICFAVGTHEDQQISFNHLSGTATVYDFTLGTAYEYSAWSFSARGVAQGRPVGTAGELLLTGQAGGYDACPAYNIVHFTPAGEQLSLGEDKNIVTLDTEIGVSICKQDLTQDFTAHWSKLVIPVWNGHEFKYTGAYECTDSTHVFPLSGVDVQAHNFTSANLGTVSAHLQLRGVESTQCGPFLPSGARTENTGLVAVAVSHLTVNGFYAAAGTTTFGAGTHAVPGFVKWNIGEPVPEVPEIR